MQNYNYNQDWHKLKLFPATLKDSSLIWFMGLEYDSVTTWDDMKQSFVKNIS